MERGGEEFIFSARGEDRDLLSQGETRAGEEQKGDRDRRVLAYDLQRAQQQSTKDKGPVERETRQGSWVTDDSQRRKAAG